MIRIDLSVPNRHKSLPLWLFALIFLGIFLVLSVCLGLGLFLQWRYLNDVENQLGVLETERDSLRLLKREMMSYNDVAGRLDSLKLEIKKGRNKIEEPLGILYLLEAKLVPGMKLVSIRFSDRFVKLECLSPSNVKIARYMDALSETEKFDSLISEPHGFREGLIDHKVTLRIK